MPLPFEAIVKLKGHVDPAVCDPFAPAVPNFNAKGDPVRTDKFGQAVTPPKLTPLWAQEEIGSDLVGQLIKDYDDDPKHVLKSQDVPVGMLDTSFDASKISSKRIAPPLSDCVSSASGCPYLPTAFAPDGTHGFHVANLIAGPYKVGSGPRAQITMAASAADPKTYKPADKEIGEGLDRFLANEGKPGFPKAINFSLVMGSTIYGSNKAKIDKLSQKTVLVMGAGNEYPLPIQEFEKNTPGIVVGSTAPDGLVSNFSQAGPEVTVCAPSDDYLNSYTGSTTSASGVRLAPFSGTSGATPLVTGAITNVQAFLPNIKTDQIKSLLKSTAIPSSGFRPDAGRNGVGVVNAYQLAQVAIRLKDAGWPAKQSPFSDSDLANPSSKLFDFSARAQDKKGQAEALLQSGGCKEMTAAVKQLREAFFLSPNDPHVRADLSALYRDYGYSRQATFFELGGAAAAISSRSEPYDRFCAAVRQLEPRGKKQPVLSGDLALSFTQIKDPAYRAQAVSYALSSLKNGAAEVLEASLKDKTPYVPLVKGGGKPDPASASQVRYAFQTAAEDASRPVAKWLYSAVLASPSADASAKKFAFEKAAERLKVILSKKDGDTSYFTAATLCAAARSSVDAASLKTVFEQNLSPATCP